MTVSIRKTAIYKGKTILQLCISAVYFQLLTLNFLTGVGKFP